MRQPLKCGSCKVAEMQCLLHGMFSDRFRRLTQVAASVWLLFFAVALPASAQEAESVGQVVRQQGTVTALRAMLPRSLHLGASVFPEDRIVTPLAAKVEIEFSDGTLLSVGSDTDVELSDYDPGSRKPGAFTLLLGIIRTKLSTLWTGGFEVRTRAAIASVRATDWVTEALDDGTAVFVVDGKVAVTGTAGAAVLLGPGSGTDVGVGGVPAPPKTWNSARVEDVLGRTRLP